MRKQKDPEISAEERRRRLDELLAGLQDDTLPPMNPIEEFEKAIGLSSMDMAAACYFSFSRWYAISAGAAASLPASFLEIVEKAFGRDGELVFQAAWTRFRNSLTKEARGKLERRLEPIPGCGMIE